MNKYIVQMECRIQREFLVKAENGEDAIQEGYEELVDSLFDRPICAEDFEGSYFPRKDRGV